MYKGVFVHWKTGEMSRVTVSANNMASLKRKASGCMNEYFMPFDIMMVTAPSGTMFKMIRVNRIYPDGTILRDARGWH